MRLKSTIFFLFCSFFAFNLQASPKIIVTIKPLFSLTSSIIGDSSDLELLIDGDVSPHDFHLQPSQMRKLYNADIIFYIDRNFENFLTKFLLANKSLSQKELSNDPNLILLKRRVRGEAISLYKADLDGEYDPHFWLDPENAQNIVINIRNELTLLYPENKEIYIKNAAKLLQRLGVLNEELQDKLSGLEGKEFISFHDAYQYFENRYRLKSLGALLHDSEELPSAKHISDIQRKIKKSAVVCVFKEPQFSEKLANLVIGDNIVKLATLDPLGSKFANDKNLYFNMLHDIADNINSCLRD